MPALQAITFDLWDTIVDDDSDEAERRARGLKSKREERRSLLWAALNRQDPISLETVSQAYDVADAAFNTVWHQQHVNWTIRTRLQVILRGLNKSLTAQALDAVVHAHERMEVEIPPNLIPGCAMALQQLSERYKLAIVSDAIVTPGWCLRDLLELHGVRKYFHGFAFSDEVGHSKPHRDMFASAAKQLDVPINSMVHIGDRQQNDIEGPHAIGMRAILFTATRDIDIDGNTADAVCASYDDLVSIIDSLAENEAES